MSGFCKIPALAIKANILLTAERKPQKLLFPFPFLSFAPFPLSFLVPFLRETPLLS